MMKSITVYTTKTCVYCDRVKNYLGDQGFKYTEVNIDCDPKKQAEVEGVAGILAVPLTIIDSFPVIGWNLSMLSDALA
jgi:glutaredoxin